MKNTLVLLLLITTSLMIASCVDKIPLSEENKVYAGKWIASDGTWVQISLGGSGAYEKSNSSIEGGSVEFIENNLKISLLGIDKNFTIDKPPYEENGSTKVKLDGVVYVKQ